MSSTPNHSTHSEHEGETHEDHVHVVENAISLYQANKIDKKNVWSIAFIDVLEQLVRNHNVYVRNFRNIGVSLDAMSKVYEIRVDSVFNDVHRLRFGVGSNAKNAFNSANEDVNCDEVDVDDVNPKRRSQQCRKRAHRKINIARAHQINGPLNVLPLADDLSYRLNKISGDTADTNRLFITILATEHSVLQLHANEKFFSNRVYERIVFQDDCMYEGYEDIRLSADLMFGEQLPIRQSLSGYRVQDTPIDVDEPENNSLDQSDIEQDYAFDMNKSIQPNPESMIFDDIVAEQDLNNNMDIASDFDNIENMNGLDVNDVSKSEYSYRAIGNILNYWAGPSYWKYSMNRPSSRSSETANVPTSHRRRPKKTIEKPNFNDSGLDSSSDNEYFIKVRSKKAKKIRQANYRRWLPEKLKLPNKCEISKDLFECYKFEPSCNAFEQHQTQPTPEPNEDTNHEDDHDFYQMNFGSPLPTGGLNEHTLNLDSELLVADISQNLENAPPVVENIQIAFDKRAKVVNIGRLNRATLLSIDRQLVNTAANESAQNIDTTYSMEPGRATFSGVFKDHQTNYRKFVKSESDLSTGLVLFSILNAVNKERLRINRRPDRDNDFDIVQLKKIPRLS